MKNELQICLIFLMSLLMVACATEPLKAPCDENANFCGTKTKINHW